MIAVTRDVSPAIEQCELTHLERSRIDVRRAREQHRLYRQLLVSLGCTVIEIPADPELPDCVFVEDTAIVLDDLAVLTRPGAESRRPEVAAVAEALTPWRRLERIEAPATIDGGDVLLLGDRLFVGLSERTNVHSIDQLRRITGREVTPLAVRGCLHLKTAVTQVSRGHLLVNREWVDLSPLSGWELVDIDPSEPFGANALLVGDALVYPQAFPRTRRRLIERGIEVHPIQADELAKAEGGVTCCSLVFP